MNQKKENILNIQYHEQKGLTFSWNLGGLLDKNVYFRHIFIMAFNDRTMLEGLVCSISSRIKNGDFIACLYKKHGMLAEKLKWEEKTSFNFQRKSFKGLEGTSSKQLATLLPFIGRETVSYSNPVIVNIITENAEEIGLYKDIIQKLRVEGYFPFHVNFLSEFNFHDICPSSGFNCINTTADTLPEVLRIYRSLAQESAVLNASVELHCSEIQLATRKEEIWLNTDFHKVRRDYYGPSIHYSHDCISFYDETHRKSAGRIQMMVSLDLTLFSGKTLRAEKAFVLAMENTRLYGMTKCEGMIPRSTFEYAKAIRSKTPPFCSASTLIITKFINLE